MSDHDNTIGRRVFLYGEISEASVRRTVLALYTLADSSARPIELFVSSCGGDLDEAFALHDVMRALPAPVNTIAVGKCMSAAPLLVACGAVGHRYATPNCTFMLHAVTLVPPEARVLEAESHVAAGRRAQSLYSELLARYSKKKRAHWSRLFSQSSDRYFSPRDAAAWGLIDKIWPEK